VAQERQQKLLEELEEENQEERARKEAERLAEEQALRAEREKKAEEERKKREEERLRKEAERRAKEEERLKKEEEKRRRAKEEKEKEERRRKEQEAKERKEREEKERKDREEKARKEKEEKERRQRDERDRKEREAKERREREARERKEKEENERKERELKEQEKVRKEKEEKERREREEKEKKDKEEKEQRSVTLPSTRQHIERKRTIPPIGQPSVQQSQPPINNQPAVQSKNVVTMSNGAINWINNYASHESHQNIPPHHAINQPHSVNHHMPPPPNHPPHPIFSQNGPQPQFGGQPGGIINGPVGMNNEIVNDVYTNNKKILNQPPQPTNTLPGMNPASSLFTTGLGPIGMGVHPHHGGPPMSMHPHHPVMRQQIPPRGFNPIGAAPHLTGPTAGVPPSVASTNLSLLNEPVISGNGNIGAAGVNNNPPPGAFGGLPLGGGQGPLGPQTFNLGTQVVGQPTSSSHIGPNVVQNAPLAPIGHRRMSQHPDDPHIKAVQRPQPIQRPSRRESVTTHTSLDTRTRSPPPGFGNMVGSGALIGDDQPHPMTNRRQSLAPVESSYFSNSLFSALPGETSQQSQSSQNQQPQPQHQLGSSRLTHRTVGDNEWPPIRRSGGTDNISDTVLNWYQEGNNNANRRVMGSSKDFIP
ncbi:12919_t:CDS:2, partial [Gigaspora rosea]